MKKLITILFAAVLSFSLVAAPITAYAAPLTTTTSVSWTDEEWNAYSKYIDKLEKSGTDKEFPTFAEWKAGQKYGTPAKTTKKKTTKKKATTLKVPKMTKKNGFYVLKKGMTVAQFKKTKQFWNIDTYEWVKYSKTEKSMVDKTHYWDKRAKTWVHSKFMGNSYWYRSKDYVNLREYNFKYNKKLKKWQYINYDTCQWYIPS